MIQIEKLCKRYGDAVVVDDVSMVIEPRTITTIVGTSGSGKSTLLRMINRLVEPTSGRVLIDGNDTTAEPAHLLRRRIGYAIQGLGLFPHRTVADNIATVPQLLGWAQDRIDERVTELLQLFQLEPAVYAGKVSARAVGRAAATRGGGPRAGGQAQCPADGRAVRRARSRSSAPRPRTTCSASSASSAPR